MHSEQRPLPPLSEQADDRGPRAFPISADEFFDRGMLLRDYFAAAALTGYLAAHADGETALPKKVEIAEYAYRMADAMLVERRKKPEPYTPSPPEAAKI